MPLISSPLVAVPSVLTAERTGVLTARLHLQSGQESGSPSTGKGRRRRRRRRLRVGCQHHKRLEQCHHLLAALLRVLKAAQGLAGL